MWQQIRDRVAYTVHPSLYFIWSDLMNAEGRRYARYTVLVVLIGSATGIVAPYGLGLIINGVSTLDQHTFLYGLVFFICVRFLDDRLNKTRLELRERVFQQNFWHIPQRLTELFFRQPTGTYINTDNALDGGGVESVNDKVWNVQSNFLFNIIPSWSMTVFGLMACTWVDVRLGIGALLYIIVEMSVARRHNQHISTEMFPIAEDYRAWKKRNRAKWDALTLVKSNGVERRVIQEVHDEVQPTLRRDDALWRVWFARAITYRRHIDLFASIVLYAVAARFAFAGTIGVEQFVLLFFSFERITMSLQDVADAQREVQKELANIETYRVQLIRPPAFRYDEGAPLRERTIDLSFAGVSLTLGTNGAERTVLRDVSFTIDSGERVGIIGPSGAGKTQLINLLLRAYNPEEGVIRVGATDLRSVAPESWLSHVGYVPQDPTVFDTSVRENVRFGVRDHTPHDDDVVWEALTRAGLDLSGRLAEGLDTVVGTKGLRLSGGQRQRLMIAQAIYKLLRCEHTGHPQLVIADEATSALDSISEAHVLDSLYQALPSGTTMLMIAHRLSSLYGCDRILLVRPLEVCAPGVPQVTEYTSLREPYESDSLFREMAVAQGFVPQ